MRTNYRRNLEIIKAYNNSDLSMREVGYMYGISKQVVNHVIQKYKDPKPKNKDRKIFIYFNGEPKTLLRTY